MVRENKTKYIILGLLCHEPMTGYDIRQAIEFGISNFWTDVSFGQIYPTLSQLEKRGHVTKKVVMDEKRPLRKVYSVTPKGRTELEKWLKKPAEGEIYKLDILLKLYFGAQTSLEDNMNLIKDFQQRNQQFLERLNAFEFNLRKVLDDSEDHFFILLTVLFGQHITEAQLQWADEVGRMLKKRAK